MASNLCNGCKSKIFKLIPGNCRKCGNRISISAYKLCRDCSKKDKVCQVCLKPLP